MIYDSWRTGRSLAGKEKNTLPSMVEPCYNPTITDYLQHPELIVKKRKPIYDDGEDISDDLPDTWSDEPLYAEIPSVRKVKKTSAPKESKTPLEREEKEAEADDSDKDEGREGEDNED